MCFIDVSGGAPGFAFRGALESKSFSGAQARLVIKSKLLGWETLNSKHVLLRRAGAPCDTFSQIESLTPAMDSLNHDNGVHLMSKSAICKWQGLWFARFRGALLAATKVCLEWLPVLKGCLRLIIVFVEWLSGFFCLVFTC